jgi:hypothetical protein
MLIMRERALSIRNGWKILLGGMLKIYKQNKNKNYPSSQLLRNNNPKGHFPSGKFKAKSLISKRLKKILLTSGEYLKRNSKYPSLLSSY